MAQDTTPAIVMYQGDGSNTVFSVPFNKGYYGEVKVLFVRRGLTDYTYNPTTYTVSGRLYAWVSGAAYVYTHTPNPGIGAPTYNSSDIEQADTVAAVAGQTITVDSVIYTRAVQHDIMNNMLLTWTGTMLEVGDYICIVRDTERGQPYEMPINQKHIEKALDNIERQVQEVKNKVDNTLAIDPTHTIDSNKMDPIEWLNSIVRSTDFSARGLRYANGWLDYSLDDPNEAEADKTWTHLLNTDNVKNIKEVVRVNPETLQEEHLLYYVDKDGVERIINMDMSIVEDAIEKAEQAYESVNTHIQDKNNPHEVTKAQVGLGNCDNTADIDKPVVVKSDTMPTASADYLGKAYLYYGNTSAVYQHGYIYECVLIPNDTLIFTPNSLSCSWTDLVVFLQNETPDYDSIVSGTMTYMESADLWRFVGKDAEDNTVLTYQQYTPDWEAVGFTFIGTFQDGDVVSFTRITTPTYVWQRMDVQPSGSRGRFLDLWDCTTGLAMGNPPISPFEYKTGDYFIVGKVSTATPPVNYKPDGASYVIGQASTVVETNEVTVDDTYFFDGTAWKLQSNSTKTLTFANIAGDIYDNTSAANALNAKQDTLPSQTGHSGEFLTTDGTNVSWTAVDALPSQTGQGGKFLTTDGTDASWSVVNADGIVNKNSAVGATNPIYDWVGTLAEYTAQDVATNHPDWVCYITDDDASVVMSSKANVDADNFTNTGKTFLSGLGRAGSKFEVLVPVNGSQYTAPANGYFVLDGIITNASGNRLYLLLKNEQYISNNKLGYQCFGIMAGYRQYAWLPVRKGDVVSVTAESTATSPDFGLRFYYAEGEYVTPPTYTEVEYIEGTYNTQYIKAGIVPTSNMKLYCKIQTTGNSSNFGWGARNITYDGVQMNISATNQYVVVDWFGASVSDRWTVSTSVTSSDIFELTIENNVAVLAKNGTNIATNTFTPTATITRELYLTAFNNNGALGTAGTTGRLYAFKLWTPDNELLLDMIPVKDGSGVACLYNRATDTLYYNQGTGSYTAGPEV